jgi:hypothetical protein
MLEGVRLPSRAVQRRHEPAVQALRTVLLGESLDLKHDGRVVAACERLDPLVAASRFDAQA